jgi:glycosyltransferase involved in cell wall biosynthesis
MPTPSPIVSSTHLVLIPSSHPGAALLRRTVDAALAHWSPVWVVDDASTDNSAAPLRELALADPRLRVITLAKNSGKGAAVHAAASPARAAGDTHALVMDADGQHPAHLIPDFMAASQAAPAALILGKPIFGPDAPKLRLHGRKLSAALVHLETLSTTAIADPLFGFRVYPLAPLAAIMTRAPRAARRYDFDPEIAVRLRWAGHPTRNLPAPCAYLRPDEGAVSHYHYLRDNLRMIALHTRLLPHLPLRLWRFFFRQQEQHGPNH